MAQRSIFRMDLIPVTLVSLLFIAQIILGFLLLPEISQNRVLAYAGTCLYICSGILFGCLPVSEFWKRGGVEKGNSYIKTTRLVGTGIYSIVRHPQYVTFILWSFAGMMVFQHWIVVLLGIPIPPLTYIDLVKADEDAIEKFGNEYREYMERVPRANFLLGIINLIRRP